MIAVVSVEIQAANPSMPLYPWRAYVNSPSSLRIRNVPRRVGNWNIDKVYVSAAYPDNSVKSAECVLVGGIWVCTIAGSASTGFSQNGYTIFADGKDENGNEVTGYVLGKGDITILEADGTITPGENTYYVHMLSAEPSTPKDGDLWQLSGSWYIYQDGTAYPIGDDSGLIRQLSNELSNYANVSALNNYFPLSGGTLSSSSGEIDIGPWGVVFHNDTVLTSTNSNTINIRLKAKIEFNNLIDENTDQTLQTQLANKADTSSLTTYELTANMQSDVSSIVLSVDSKPTGWIATPATFQGTPITFDISQESEERWLIVPMAEVDLGSPKTYTGQDKTYVWTEDWTGYHDYGPLSATFQQGYSRNALGLVTVDELSSQISSKADVSSLNDYELTANMQSDVSSIVLSTETSESWNYQFPQAVVDAGYTIITFDYYEGEGWTLEININDVGDFQWYSNNSESDTNLTFDYGFGYETFGPVYATKTTTTRNALGLVMESELSDYATKTYAVHNLSGVANAISMPLSSYEAISATADVETLYVITED